ncbi:MAG: aminotransferase class V-fold PLP-dependent enzyme [Polyangiaceae bacterium]|nr:aminotransferase class V-fold PLP-dependent enzyme [Polyangiaceae bacterium]
MSKEALAVPATGPLAPALYKDAPELTPRLGNRDLFGGLEPLVYMNHAGISPPSVCVRKAVTTLLTDYGKKGASAYPTWAAQRARLRDKLAWLIGAPGATSIALTLNTTRGISDVALCFDWKPGDRVVLFSGEFPANVTPWQQAAGTFGVEVVMLDGRRFPTDEAGVLADLEATLEQGRVRLVAASYVQFQTGYRLPLADIGKLCHAHGARLFVDAVQGLGMVSLDVQAFGVDFVACGAHKWLMGTEGAGFLYASPEAVPLLTPRVAGWLSHDDAATFLFEGPDLLRHDRPIRTDIGFLEGANLSAMSFAALEASLDLILRLGLEEVFEHVQKVNDAIEGPAKELGFRSLRSENPERRSGSLCLLPPEGVDVIALQREIVRQGVACATPDGYLRFSPHWPNAVDEADQVVLTLEHALGVVRA